MKEFRYHPEIEGLKVNEDGSQIFLNDQEIPVKIRKSGNHPFRFVYIMGKTVGISRLILECWRELSPTPKHIAKHIDGDFTNYHHINLEWGNPGGNSKYQSKLNAQKESEILEKINAGKCDSEIAKEYGVTRNAIFNLRKKLQK